MGAWQMTQKRLATLDRYKGNYDHIIGEIVPHLNGLKSDYHIPSNQTPVVADTIYLILGSERGLCGKFNETLAEEAVAWIEAQDVTSFQIWAAGKRMVHTLERMDISFSWRKSLPITELISYRHAYLLTQNWLEQYETRNFNRFVLIHNHITNGHHSKFSNFTLLPFHTSPSGPINGEEESKWPPPIIETDPKGIYQQIIHQYLSSSLYQILLKSAAAEHAARFYLMEDAQENAKDIIEELDQIINTERRRKITQQVQELAVGAGLLDNK